MKRCYHCKETKSLDAFSKYNSSPDGRQSQCKDCAREWWYDYQLRVNPNYVRPAPRRTREKAVGKRTASQRWRFRKYGITPCEHARMRIEQNDQCKICGGLNNGKPLNVDHCHDSGKVRGLLCARCNAALGALGDNIDGLKKALAYLEAANY